MVIRINALQNEKQKMDFKQFGTREHQRDFKHLTFLNVVCVTKFSGFINNRLVGIFEKL